MFVAKVHAGGTHLDYCGYIGGDGVEYGHSEIGDCIAVNSSGNAYVAGHTNSTESTFPVVNGPDLTFNGLTDAFVARVNADGSHLHFCGYIGGTTGDIAKSIAVDDEDNAYICGYTNSTESSFPVLVGPDLTHNGGSDDGFVAKIKYSTALNVPGEYPTIQAAISAAGDGDTVLVAPGTYVENIDFLGKAITVKSTGGPDVTCIDGNQASSVVTFKNGEGPDSVLEGFEIKNGFTDQGGGVICQLADPTVKNNTITGNIATSPIPI
jgi:hypothetical protein